MLFSTSHPVQWPVVTLLTASLLGACTQTTQTALEPRPPAHARVVASGLNGPQGVHVALDGTVYAVDSGAGGTQPFSDAEGAPPQTIGNTAQVVRVGANGQQSVVATLPSIGSEQGASGAGRVTSLNGTLYVTSGDWTVPAPTLNGQPVARPVGVGALVQIAGNGFTEIADAFAFEQRENPDNLPPEREGEPGLHAHPYGLAASPDGKTLYIADAGGNDVLKFDIATKTLSLVAVFAPLQHTTEEGKTVTVQAVPTGVTFGQDGALYVSLFPGEAASGPDAPPVAVPAKVVRLDPQTRSVTEYATGLTALTDVQRGPDGNLYAVSIASNFAPNSGTVTRLKAGGVKELVLGGLNYPTSIAFNNRGDAFIADNGIGAPQSGRVLRYDYLTQYGAQ